MTKKSKLTLAIASMLGITAGATAVSGFAWFTTTKSADVEITNIGVYSTNSALAVSWTAGQTAIGCQEGSGQAGLNVVGAASTSTLTQVFTTTEDTAAFTLDKHPHDIVSVAISDTDGQNSSNGTVNSFDDKTRVVTLDSTVASGKKVTITYHPYEALTDLSSVDGQKIYKPTWTASGEGRYATAFTEAATGYVQFSMTLTATGGSDLRVFLNPGASIAPVDNTNNDDIAAAHIARLAVIDSTTTRFVLQQDTDYGTQGVTTAYTTSAFNHRLATGEGANDCWDLKATGGNALPPVPGILDQGDITSKASRDATWASTAGNQKASECYITTVTAGHTKDVKVTIWLEGTNYTEDSGTFTTSPEKGAIKVNLPLIAF